MHVESEKYISFLIYLIVFILRVNTLEDMILLKSELKLIGSKYTPHPHVYIYMHHKTEFIVIGNLQSDDYQKIFYTINMSCLSNDETNFKLQFLN